MSNFDDIFEPAPQAEDFDKEAWAAKKKAERDERYATADATAEEVCKDSGKFRDYLDVQANFRHYSADTHNLRRRKLYYSFACMRGGKRAFALRAADI